MFGTNRIADKKARKFESEAKREALAQLREALHVRVTRLYVAGKWDGIKAKYWHELIDKLNPVLVRGLCIKLEISFPPIQNYVFKPEEVTSGKNVVMPNNL